MLMLPDAELMATRLSQEGNYTAERLKRDRPEVYRAVQLLLAEGQSIRAIKRVCGVHHRTIEAVAAAESIAIDTDKKEVVRTLRALQAALVESLYEDVLDGKLKPEAKPLATAIITDKLELLQGNATSRVETVHGSENAPRTWDAWLNAAQGTGLSGGKNGAMGELVAPKVHRLAHPTIPVEAVVTRESDSSSFDSQSKTDGDTSNDTRDGDQEATEAAEDRGEAGDFKGGGGGRFVPGSADSPTD